MQLPPLPRVPQKTIKINFCFYFCIGLGAALVDDDDDDYEYFDADGDQEFKDEWENWDDDDGN